MTKWVYKLDTGATLDLETWKEASPDEIRILSYLLCCPHGAGEAEIGKACGTARARTKSALALWREAGMILRTEAEVARQTDEKPVLTLEKADLTAAPNEPEVTLEFPERPRDDGDDLEAREVASIIRDHHLRELYDDISKLLKKPSLPDRECKQLAGCYNDSGMSREYITTLATYLCDKAEASGKRFTVVSLIRKVNYLTERGIDTLEALEAFIESDSRTSAAFYEYRKIIGIWSRNLTAREMDTFARWENVFGYGEAIVTAAFDITVANTNKASVAYMDKILSAWYAAGVRTLSDVDAHLEKSRKEAAAKTAATPKSRKKTAETPAYSDFNAEEAMMRALERSYADEDQG